MKLGIIGNYGATNLGDDAILAAFLRHHGEHSVTVFSANPSITYQQFGKDSVPLFPLGIRSTLKRGYHLQIRALKNVDGVVLGGGGLFQDDKLYACFLWAWQVFWVKRFKKPLFVYAGGIGPLKTRVGKWLAKKAFSYAQVITVRDRSSKAALQSIGIDPEKIQLVADPAFLFRLSTCEGSPQKGTYIISLRPWFRHNEFIIDAFTRALLRLKETKNVKFVFVSMQKIKEHDKQMLQPLVKRVGGQLVEPKHFSELLTLMQNAEFAVGMRYHFLIAALITCTPAIGIPYSPKVSDLFNGSALERYMISMDQVNADTLEHAFKELSVDYNNIKIYEKSRLEAFRASAEKTIAIFKNWAKTFDEKS